MNSKLRDWQFHVLGDGDVREEIERRVKELGLSNIFIHGIKDPQSFYFKSRILCMTSAYEGFPNVIIEAQSYGVVPVAFDSYPALSEIVENGRNAVLIEPYDCVAMALAIFDLAIDFPKLDRLANESLINAKKYDTLEIGQLWLPLFA